MKTVKEKLYDFQEVPPAATWDKIAGQLGSSTVVSMQGRKKTRRLALITAAAAVMALALINFVFVNNRSAPPGQITSVHADHVPEKNNQLLESIINTPIAKKLKASQSLASNGSVEYFTIEGPEGEPVKISPKVATLIVSADNEYPPKPVWDKQISEWQQIMLTNSITPSSASLIDIIQQASSTMK